MHTYIWEHHVHESQRCPRTREVTQGRSLSVDIFDGTKFQGHFGIEQMSPWTFWTRPNALQAFQYS